MERPPPFKVCSNVNFIVLINNFTKMNKLKLLFYIFFFSIPFSNNLYAQEKTNIISLSGSAAQYFGIHDFGKPTYEDSYKFPVSPGAEIIYWRQISNSINIGTGLNYQRIHHESQLDSPDYRYDNLLKFNYEEASIAILLRKSFPVIKQDLWFITFGLYNGKQYNIIMQTPNSVGWQPWENNSSVGGFSKDTFYSDLYLDAGYAFQLGNSGEISLAPFYKYRVNSTWVNTYLKKSILGINLSYSFKF